MIAILQIVFLILRLLGTLLWTLLTNPFRRAFARWTFWRTLRRCGLNLSEAEELTGAYRPGLRLGDVFRAARVRVS